MAHSVSVCIDWGFVLVSTTVLLSVGQGNGDVSIPGSRVCTDIDVMRHYKIILIGAITSVFSQDITVYDAVNE